MAGRPKKYKDPITTTITVPQAKKEEVLERFKREILIDYRVDISKEEILKRKQWKKK